MVFIPARLGSRICNTLEILRCMSFRGVRRCRKSEVSPQLQGAQTRVSVLPDEADFFCGLDHGLACFAAEGLSEFGHVHYYAVDAVLGWGVRIDLGAQAQVFGAVVGAVPLGVADEEALLGA